MSRLVTFICLVCLVVSLVGNFLIEESSWFRDCHPARRTSGSDGVTTTTMAQELQQAITPKVPLSVKTEPFPPLYNNIINNRTPRHKTKKQHIYIFTDWLSVRIYMYGILPSSSAILNGRLSAISTYIYVKYMYR